MEICCRQRAIIEFLHHEKLHKLKLQKNVQRESTATGHGLWVCRDIQIIYFTAMTCVQAFNDKNFCIWRPWHSSLTIDRLLLMIITSIETNTFSVWCACDCHLVILGKHSDDYLHLKMSFLLRVSLSAHRLTISDYQLFCLFTAYLLCFCILIVFTSCC